MLLPCQPAARKRPLVTRSLSRSKSCLVLIIILVLIGREVSRAATQIRYASRIVETKSGQIRGILQVCIDFLLFESHSSEQTSLWFSRISISRVAKRMGNVLSNIILLYDNPSFNYFLELLNICIVTKFNHILSRVYLYKIWEGCLNLLKYEKKKALKLIMKSRFVAI